MKPRISIPHVEEIASRNLAQWRSRQEALAEKGLRTAVRPGPYLTISRQYGAGAEELVSALSTDLGWRVYDRLLLEEMAHRAQVDQRVLQRVESGPHNSLHDAILLSFDRDYPGHLVYFKHMVALVSSLGLEGRVILVGRGAHHLLPADAGLRVRCVAPFDERVEGIRESRQLTRREAEECVREGENKQREMARKFFHCDPDEASNYDLVLNLADLGIPVARDVVGCALEAKLGQTFR
jgi:hypothetical protein